MLAQYRQTAINLLANQKIFCIAKARGAKIPVWLWRLLALRLRPTPRLAELAP
jgi:hypothetical protein